MFFFGRCSLLHPIFLCLGLSALLIPWLSPGPAILAVCLCHCSLLSRILWTPFWSLRLFMPLYPSSTKNLLSRQCKQLFLFFIMQGHAGTWFREEGHTLGQKLLPLPPASWGRKVLNSVLLTKARSSGALGHVGACWLRWCTLPTCRPAVFACTHHVVPDKLVSSHSGEWLDPLVCLSRILSGT